MFEILENLLQGIDLSTSNIFVYMSFQETDKDLNETEEYKDAQVQLEEARKVIDAEQQS